MRRAKKYTSKKKDHSLDSKCPSPSNHYWAMILEASCWSKYPLFSQTGTRLLCKFNLDKYKMSSSSSSMHDRSLQSCPALSDPMDYSPPGSSVHGIFQERILEWITISFSRGYSWSRDSTQISYVSCIGRQVFLLLGPPGKPSSPRRRSRFYTEWKDWKTKLNQWFGKRPGILCLEISLTL